MSTEHRVGVYAWCPSDGRGVDFFRITEPLRVLAAHGNRASWGLQLDNDILSTVDTVLAHQIHSIEATEAWQTLAKADDHRLVLDVDDAMWCPDWKPFKDNYSPEVLGRLFANIAAAHVVTSPSDLICEYLSRYNPNVHWVPNTVPGWLIGHTMPARECPTIGYQGSSHHERDWNQGVVRQLGRFLSAHPDWRMQTYGPIVIEDDSGRIGNTPWLPSIEDFYRSVSFDVGIGPLRDTPFNRCKSGIRAIEYAALGVIPVLPDMHLYRPWIVDGINGVLIKSHQTLSGVLRAVASDPEWMAKASEASKLVAATWTTEVQIERWINAWHSL